jgi:hypothetical protein
VGGFKVQEKEFRPSEIMAKQPSKPQKNKEIVGDLPPPSDFGVWFSLRTEEVGSASQSRANELDWAATQLGLVLPIDRKAVAWTSTDAIPSAETLSNSRQPESFCFLEVVDKSEAEAKGKALSLPWQSFKTLSNYPWSPSVILLAIASRNASVESCAKSIQQQFPAAKVGLVLGEWWTGHSRTWRIIENFPSFYWYQVWDRIVPFALDSRSSSSPHDSRLAQRAVVMSDAAETRQLWREIFADQAMVCFACRRPNEAPEGEADVVVLDAIEQFSEAEVQLVRRIYPDARIAGLFGFPRWSVASRYIESGCDIVAGKPFNAAGLLQSLRRSSRLASSAALPRK